MYVAGIDIGTTSVCCVIADAETGLPVSVETAANDAGLASRHGWDRTQDADRIIAIAEELIARQPRCWERVRAIGISCQMHGILYVDALGRAVSPLYTWQDRRGDCPVDGSEPCGPQANDADGAAAVFAVSCVERMKELTGRTIAAGYGMATHFYNELHGQVPSAAVRLCTIGDYAAMRLSGANEPLIDASNAVALGLFDPAAGEFDFAAVAKLGLRPELLPRLAGAAEVAGLTKDGKKVGCAIGDNQASFLGSVPSLARSMLVNIGTGAQISIYSERPEIVPLLETRPFPGGGCLLVGASLGGGKTYALLEALFRDVHDSLAAAPLGASRLYDRMNELAEAALRDGAPPLRVAASFFGTRAEPERTGAIHGITGDNWTAGQLALGFLHGIADELLEFADAFPAWLRGRVDTVVASGNGVRGNRVMRRLLREKLGHPLRLSPVREEAAFGAAIDAAARSGIFPDREAAIARFGKE